MNSISFKLLGIFASQCLRLRSGGGGALCVELCVVLCVGCAAACCVLLSCGCRDGVMVELELVLGPAALACGVPCVTLNTRQVERCTHVGVLILLISSGRVLQRALAPSSLLSTLQLPLSTVNGLRLGVWCVSPRPLPVLRRLCSFPSAPPLPGGDFF